MPVIQSRGRNLEAERRAGGWEQQGALDIQGRGPVEVRREVA